MSKKNKQLNISQGVMIEPIESVGKKSAFKTTCAIIIQIMIAMSATLGAVTSFTTMMGVELSFLALILSGIILSAAFSVLFLLIKKSWAIFVGTFTVIAAICAVFWGTIHDGVLAIFDESMKTVAKSMKWSEPNATVRSGGLYFDKTVTICLIAAVVALIVSFFVVKRVSIIGTFLTTFPFFEVGAAFGCVPSRISFALMLGAWVAVIVLKTGVSGTKIKSKSIKKVGHKTYRNNKSANNRAFGALCVGLCAVILFFGTSAVLGGLGYGRSGDMNRLRHNIKSELDSTIDYILGSDNDGSLKEGKLYKMGDIKVKERHYMTLETPNFSENLYLRGYVGAKYTGVSWEDIDYSKMNKALIGLSDSSPVAIFTGSMMNSDKYCSQYPQGDVKIYDLRRKKPYAYLTYGAFAVGGFSAQDDRYMNCGDSSEYSYFSYFNGNSPYDLSLTPLYKSSSIKSAFSSYCDLVKTEYTALPNMPQSLNDVAQKLSGSDYHKIDEVRDYLNNNTEFSAYSKKLPSGEDFVDYFVNDQKHGYYAHYATAAAVLLRMSGVATRYVEGYLIPQTQIEKSGNTGDGAKKIEVTDANAHAWIEIFTEKYGWIPVEVTPGYYSGSFEEQMKETERQNEQIRQTEPEDTPDEKSNDKIDAPKVDKNNIDGTQEIIKREKFWIIDYSVVLPIVFAADVLLLILALSIIRAVRVKKLKESLKMGNATTRMFALYRYFERLLKFEKIRKDDCTSYDEFLSKIKQSKYIDEMSADRIMSLFMKSAYSGAPTSEGDYSDAKEIVLKFADSVYDNKQREKGFLGSVKNVFRKLKFKFINNLK